MGVKRKPKLVPVYLSWKSEITVIRFIFLFNVKKYQLGRNTLQQSLIALIRKPLIKILLALKIDHLSPLFILSSRIYEYAQGWLSYPKSVSHFEIILDPRHKLAIKFVAQIDCILFLNR